MRTIEWLDFTGEDTQQCLAAINKELPKRGVDEKDIINVQYQLNNNSGETARLTLYVFYWSEG